MENNLKLYVWKDVLCDYGPGMILVLAESVEEARKLVIEEGDEDDPELMEDIKGEPRIIIAPEAFLCQGSA